MNTRDFENPTIRSLIEEKLPQLPKKQQQVAHHALNNPAALLFSSSVEVAHQSGVDPATVVRFAQNLGFSGYTEFRDSVRLEFPALRTPLDRWDEDISSLDASDSTGVVERVWTQTTDNLARTFERISPQLIDQALDHILGASTVTVVGGGSSYVLAAQLFRVLKIAQVPTQLIEDWFGLLFSAASMQATDVIFGVTSWRYAKVTIEALSLARAAGCTTILLTDDDFAPGSTVADILLLFSPSAIGELASPVAGAAMIDCLAAGLVKRVPDKVRESMRQLTALSKAHGLTVD